MDYCLIFTFIAFFIFTGNIGRLPAFQEILHSLVNGRELLVGIATSQVISNVPAALLLSGFSGDLKQLLLGVNLGGLGTLIASMASLISYKYMRIIITARRGIICCGFIWQISFFSRYLCCLRWECGKMGGRIKCRKNN